MRRAAALARLPASAKRASRPAPLRACCTALALAATAVLAVPVAAGTCKASRLIGDWQHVEGKDGDMAIRYHHVWTFQSDGSMRCTGETCAIYPLGEPRSWRLERNRSLRITFDSGESPLDVCRTGADGETLRWRSSIFRKQEG